MLKKRYDVSFLFSLTPVSQNAIMIKLAVVAELAYAHDSGSCPYCLGVGSSPINCTPALWTKGRDLLK